MDLKAKIARINELAQKAKSDAGLTAAEKKEQHQLRQEYLAHIRGHVETHLHNLKVVDTEGKDVTPQKLQESKKQKKH